jgi:UDP-N-acetylglucosamine 2-epimerase (non-hydrolysing)
MIKKILVVFGTRPEAIKMAPLIKVLDINFEVIVCVTAQHREMMDQVLNIFDINPTYDLNIMKPGQDLYDITTKILIGMKKVLNECSPDMVLVHGDTSTTMATAISAFYAGIPIGHVEAGLRTFNMKAPFPEEFNRKITAAITDIHFAPTKKAYQNLIQEGVKEDSILITGNTVIDALYLALDKAKKLKFPDTLIEDCPFLLDTKDNKLILITGHRRENFGDGFEQICKGIAQAATKYPEINFIYPVHLNPNVQEPVKRILSSFKNIFLVEPLDYLPFIKLMDKSYFILTDSGGIQEEAPSLGKPVLVMRDETERPEGVSAGTVKLVGTEHQQIFSNIELLIENEEIYIQMSQAHNPFGNGTACLKIDEHLRRFFK